MTSAVWRPEPLGKIIRRKLMPNLKHVTWRYPTLTPSRLAISSRLIQLHVSGEKVSERWTLPAIGYVEYVDTRHHLEQLAD